MTTWLEKLGPLAGLAAVVILFAVLRPAEFATGGNAEIMLLQTAVVANPRRLCKMIACSPRRTTSVRAFSSGVDSSDKRPVSSSRRRSVTRRSISSAVGIGRPWTRWFMSRRVARPCSHMCSSRRPGVAEPRMQTAPAFLARTTATSRAW